MNCRLVNIVGLTFFFIALPVLALAHGITEGDKQLMLEGGSFRYMMLGVKILPSRW